MKNGGVWRRLAGSLLGTRQIYLCGAVSNIQSSGGAVTINKGEENEQSIKIVKSYIMQELNGNNQAKSKILYLRDRPARKRRLFVCCRISAY